MNAITEFSGENEFLSNFFENWIWWKGLEFPTNEHAFVAAKTLDKKLRKKIAHIPTPGQAKRFGRQLELRSDWEQIKFIVMRRLLEIKFIGTDLEDLLRATGKKKLIEGNVWHDNIWGNCICNKCRLIPGQNMLGRLLMETRDLII